MIRSYAKSVTTDGSGDATAYVGSKITGKVLAINYAPGTLDTGADLTITGETTTAPVLVKANCGTSTIWIHPRILPNKHTDGSAFTDVASDAPRVFGERIKIVVAQGGDTKTGTLTFYVDEEMYRST